jgi:hypothetical protein
MLGQAETQLTGIQGMGWDERKMVINLLALVGGKGSYQHGIKTQCREILNYGPRNSKITHISLYNTSLNGCTICSFRLL